MKFLFRVTLRRWYYAKDALTGERINLYEPTFVYCNVKRTTYAEHVARRSILCEFVDSNYQVKTIELLKVRQDK